MSGLFPNALHVARREYVVRVRSRTFVITTALLAIVAAAVVMLPLILQAVGAGDPPRLAVANRAGELATDPATLLRASLASPGSESPDPDAVALVDDVQDARRAVRDGQYDGLLIIERSTDDELAFEFFADAGPLSETRLLVQEVTQRVTEADRLERAGIPAEQRELIGLPADFEAVAASDDGGGPTEQDFGAAYILAYAVVILTFMAILTYGNWVAQSVAEEKSNRVMELLVTAATPRQLLTGKVLGTGAAGLTQYAVVIAAGVIGFVASGPLEDALGLGAADTGFFELPAISAITLVLLTVFFLGGFLLYSILYAAAGSMVSRIEDVQQAAGPLLILAMAGYFISFTALNAIDANWVAIASQVPFFSPYLMPARLLLGPQPPLPEVALALGILAASIVVAIWIAARIYSAGVLLYGQRVGLREVLRATRVAR